MDPIDKLFDLEADLSKDSLCNMPAPREMRMLALVANNNMKKAMKAFVISHKKILRNFVLCGTETTLKVLRSVFADDTSVQYGPGFTSGPLGGDAQCGAMMRVQELGGMIFFQDPLTAHPHQADIASLLRLASIENIVVATNPATATVLMMGLKQLLLTGKRHLMPSFFQGSVSPAVKLWKQRQMAKAQHGGSADEETRTM